MALSSDLISQFVKITNDNKKTVEETTVYGTIVEYEGSPYVRLDGSELLTPITTTTVVKPGERVAVMIKNHTATVTGNVTSPSAQDKDVADAVNKANDAMNKISEFEIVVAYRVKADELEAINATINNLQAKVAKISSLSAVEADIEKLRAEYAKLDYVQAKEVEALNAKIENIQAKFGDFTDISTEELEALNADISQLKAYNADFTYVSADVLKALKASIDNLDVENFEAKYANIDFSNIGEAAIEKFFSKSGLIEDVVVGEGTVTGMLVGVTIKGDLIEGGTVVADKLVIQGTDGLYYKLNTDGVTTEAEQTNYNSLNGSIITAKSITATKIAVDDLVAFGATIGGFYITSNSIYSGAKSSVSNTTRGSYMDSDGQVAFGDGNNFIKYYRDSDGNFKLALSAASIVFATSKKDVETAIIDAHAAANAAQEAANKNAADMASVITAINADIENLQTQIDGSITSWFYEIPPTLDNEPAVNWTTVDLKNAHLGDIYYDTVTGYSYRWQISNNTYSWQAITDTDLTKALNDAKKAQDTADSKRRIFYVTPTPPYDAGDLWVQGNAGDILVCKTAKTSGQSYQAADWVAASKYTDDTAANKAQNDIDNLTIGSRNLIVRSTETIDYWVNTAGGVTDCDSGYMSALSVHIEVEPGTEYVLSRKASAASDGGLFRIAWYDEERVYISRAAYGALEQVITPPDGARYIRIAYPYDAYSKFEKGNRATDWTPAPEDMATADDNAIAQATAEAAQETAKNAEALIQQLSDSISMLVTDGNGTSLMTQTEDGWTFSTAEIQASVNNVSENLNNLTDDLGSTSSAVDVLKQAVADLGEIAEYVKIGTYENEPCIELGESDSEFKMRITNTRILFMEGSNVVAHISNQSLHIKKAVIEDELQQGDFVWQIRSNGNLGLIWKG